MSTKKKWQWVVILIIVIEILLSILGTNWHNVASVLAFVGVVLASAVSIASLFVPSGYTYYYTADDYTKLENDNYKLSIPASKHGQGKSPSIQYFQGEKGVYELVLVSPTCDEKGNIIIELPEQSVMTGKVVIS